LSGLPLKLIVGLGNPGAKYVRTRHNVGYWFVDEISKRHGGIFRAESKHQGEIAALRINEDVLWLLKPTTFMNRSGASILSLCSFYRITPAQILIVHDDLDLEVGFARLKLAGGHGGHNGLRDTIATLGADFWRLRLGIGHPGHKDLVLDYVLQCASASDEVLINEAVNSAADLLPLLLQKGHEKAMNQLHQRTKF